MIRLVRETSKKTYKDLVREGLIGDAQLDVLIALENIGVGSDLEIAKYLNKSDPNLVRPRRKELLDLGVVVDAGKVVCGVSGRLVHQWSLNRGLVEKRELVVGLSDREFRKLFDLLNNCNGFQRKRVLEFVGCWE